MTHQQATQAKPKQQTTWSWFGRFLTFFEGIIGQPTQKSPRSTHLPGHEATQPVVVRGGRELQLCWGASMTGSECLVRLSAYGFMLGMLDNGQPWWMMLDKGPIMVDWWWLNMGKEDRFSMEKHVESMIKNTNIVRYKYIWLYLICIHIWYTISAIINYITVGRQ